MTTRNKERFYKIAEDIERLEDHYKQANWFEPDWELPEYELPEEVDELFHDAEWCNTRCCIAGSALVHEGLVQMRVSHARWAPPGDNPVVRYELKKDFLYLSGYGQEYMARQGQNAVDYAEPIAAFLLGLDQDEANTLFSSSWEPRKGLTVPEALRMLGDGASMEEVMYDPDDDMDDGHDTMVDEDYETMVDDDYATMGDWDND